MYCLLRTIKLAISKNIWKNINVFFAIRLLLSDVWFDFYFFFSIDLRNSFLSFSQIVSLSTSSKWKNSIKWSFIYYQTLHLRALSPHYLCCEFKEICNVLEIIKLLTIHTCIRFGKPSAYICLYYTCQNLLCIGFQQFVILFLAHNKLIFISQNHKAIPPS